MRHDESLSILIADDCPITRRLLTMFLKKHGHHVTITENGEECFHVALSGHHDLLITDIDMPKMNGIESANAIRKAGIDFPIIAMTASFPEMVREQCFKVGMNAFMTKPLNFSQLAEKLKEISAQRAIAHPVA